MFKRILVPLDGSACAEEILSIAARIAQKYDATIVLLQVAKQAQAVAVSAGIDRAQESSGRELAAAREYLISMTRAPFLQGIKTEIEAIAGPTAAMILSYARQSQMDLLVLSSHGQTGVTRWTLGSVAAQVARYSSVPVLILHEDSHKPISFYADGTHPLRILIALDGSPLAEAVIAPAAYLVAALSTPGLGELHLAQVVDVARAGCGSDEVQHEEQATHDATSYLNAVIDRLHNGLVTSLALKITSSVLRDKDIASALLKAANPTEEASVPAPCDLTALLVYGSDDLHKCSLGPITERVLEGSRWPLLLVRAAEQAK